MEQFDIIDVSGDVGIKAYGGTIEEVFANAALGMYSLITDLKDISENQQVTIEAEGHSIDGLLVAWLNELIFRFDTYGFIGKKIEISDFGFRISDFTHLITDNRTYIKARVYGDDFNPERHERRLLIKAATYHKLKIEKTGDAWEAAVIFDI